MSAALPDTGPLPNMRRGAHVDCHGHTWPWTGAYCQICRWPLIKATADQTVHPTCAPTTNERKR